MIKRVMDASSGIEIDVEFTEDEMRSFEELRIESLEINLRMKRDILLSSSDFRMVADAPWDTGEWAAYRQALRDLPAHPDWPNVDFPDPPEVN